MSTYRHSQKSKSPAERIELPLDCCMSVYLVSWLTWTLIANSLILSGLTGRKLTSHGSEGCVPEITVPVWLRSGESCLPLADGHLLTVCPR